MVANGNLAKGDEKTNKGQQSVYHPLLYNSTHSTMNLNTWKMFHMKSFQQFKWQNSHNPQQAFKAKHMQDELHTAKLGFNNDKEEKEKSITKREAQ